MKKKGAREKSEEDGKKNGKREKRGAGYDGKSSLFVPIVPRAPRYFTLFFAARLTCSSLFHSLRWICLRSSAKEAAAEERVPLRQIILYTRFCVIKCLFRLMYLQ